ncbi:MAG TPA: hypothetical protein VEG39_09665 [Clostridia bacterium]|nr:hypothetical protein [Clostridia bacterium]
MKRLNGVLRWNMPNFVLIFVFIFMMISLFNGIIANAEEQEPITTETEKIKAPELVTSIAEIHSDEELILSVKNYSGSIAWASSDPYIATVDKNGIVTGRHKAGVTYITAKTSDMSLTCKVTNNTVMNDISAKELVSKIKIGSNFASSLDYIDFDNKMGYNDYYNRSSEVNIAFTLWEPGKDYFYSD